MPTIPEFALWVLMAALMGLGLVIQLPLLIRNAFWPIKLVRDKCVGCGYPLEGLAQSTAACPECGRSLSRQWRPLWGGPGFWRKLRHPLFLWGISAAAMIAPVHEVFWVRHRIVEGGATYRIPLKIQGQTQPFIFETRIAKWGQCGFVSLRDMTLWSWSEPDHYEPLTLTPPLKELPPLGFEAGTRTLWVKGYAKDWAALIPERTLTTMEKAALDGGDAVHFQMDLKPEMVKKAVEIQWKVTLEEGQEKIVDALLDHVVKNPPGTHLPNLLEGVRPQVVTGLPAGSFGRGMEEITYWWWIYIAAVGATVPGLVAVGLRLWQMRRRIYRANHSLFQA
jgi:hypothetical protein